MFEHFLSRCGDVTVPILEQAYWNDQRYGLVCYQQSPLNLDVCFLAIASVQIVLLIIYKIHD